MPAFPERESSLLSKLHQSAPWTAKLHNDTLPDSTASSEQSTASNVEPVANGLIDTKTSAVSIGMPVEPLLSTGIYTACVLCANSKLYVYYWPPSFLLLSDVLTPSIGTNSVTGNILIDVFGDIGVAPISTAGETSVSPGAEEGYKRFITKSNGILFENNTLQIGVKSEFKKNLGEQR